MQKRKPEFRLPGLHRELEMRFWTIVDLARAAGLTWATVATAEQGEPVSAATAKKIELALEANPPSPTALRLLNDELVDATSPDGD